VNCKTQSETCLGAPDHSRRLWFRAAGLALLFTVIGLSTFAKNSQYLPKSDPVHYTNIASKMKVAQSPAILDQEPLHIVANLVPPQPDIQTKNPVEDEVLALPSIGITASIQYRSPPPSLV
jgi:hypothetical protein